MMTHSPKNPYCQACQRAKMQRKPHRKSKTPVEERRQATEFADLVTGDHIITVAKVDKSIDGKSDGLVLYDVATGYMDCFPAYTKNAEETIQALQQFLGPKGRFGQFYSDAAAELFAAAKTMGLNRDSSTQGRPESNGLAENKVRKVLEGSRTVLDHAGLPPSYWSYACKHYCFGHNHSKFYQRGEELPEPIMGRLLPDGFSLPPLYPFGCLVDFLPSPIFHRKFPKWGTKAQPGILLGYPTRPGGVWKKEFLVAMLADFQEGESKPQVHTIREVTPVMKDGAFVFPLKERYEQLRNTVSVPSKSDKSAERPDADEPQEDEAKDSSATSTSKQESDKLNDMSPIPIEDDSGPKEGGEDKTDLQKEEKEEAPEAQQEKTTKDNAGFDESFGMKTRKKKGSQRPPDIPGVVWVTMSPKQRQVCIQNYERTGFGWPAKEQGTAPDTSGPTVAATTSLLQPSVPAMPTILMCRKAQEHRPQIPDINMDIYQICVARTVTKKEASVTPAALAALDKEWTKLEKQNAWLLDKVREWKSVSAEAKANNKTVHVGRVFAILVEKGSELPVGHPERKFKGRVVFQGNNVRDQGGDYALFEELTSAPATTEAGKAVDAYGCVEGNL